MDRIPKDYIDLIITSPPYDNIRDYDGHEFTFSEFQDIAKSLYRVLKPGRCIVWVVGDKAINGSESLTSFRQALFFKEIGFRIHDTMIYQKGGSPYPELNRYKQVFEYMFIISKGKPSIFNPIKDRKNIFLKRGMSMSMSRQKDGTTKRVFVNNKEKFGNRDNVWEYQIGYMKSSKDEIAFKHPATFPEALARDHILSWSNEGCIVYDPMSGSGTVAKQAALNNRFYIGSEISKEYVKQSNLRMSIIKKYNG